MYKKNRNSSFVSWKDIYGLILLAEKYINNQKIIGPLLILRGITSNQINERHAFLIYLIFLIKIPKRNLEENEIKILTICQVKKGVDEINNDINMVEYECIGNYTKNENLSNYILDNIEGGNNEGELKNLI